MKRREDLVSQFRFIVRMAKLFSLRHVNAFFPSSMLFPILVVDPSARILISSVTISQIDPSPWSSCSRVCSIDNIHWEKLCCSG